VSNPADFSRKACIHHVQRTKVSNSLDSFKRRRMRGSSDDVDSPVTGTVASNQTTLVVRSCVCWTDSVEQRERFFFEGISTRLQELRAANLLELRAAACVVLYSNVLSRLEWYCTLEDLWKNIYLIHLN
jgi:hypothetical protein